MNPTAKQEQFLRALPDYQYLLYGGAGGGGKSYCLRWALLSLLVDFAAKGHYGVQVGLFSKDYPTLQDRQLSKIRREFPEWLGTFSEQAREFRVDAQWGGGVLCFRNLDDPSKYKSAEFAAIAVEELTEHEEQTFHDLRFRLRWPGIETTRFLAATNPGGIGHAWVKRFWINQDFPDELRPKARSFCYVPAKATDNPHNAQSYLQELDSLPPSMRAAVRDGSWDVFSGQMFDVFRREIHVCRPFKIPSWWPLWGSNDPGFNDPGVWYLMAGDQDGDVHIVREWYFNDRTSYSKQAETVAKDIEGLEIGYWVTGMDAFAADPETKKTIVDYYIEGGLSGFIKPDHGSGARMRRAATWHEYLKVRPNGKGGMSAKVHIFETCRKLIETLPSLPADPNHPDQVQECAIDHAFDASGYGLQSRHGIALPAKPKYPDHTFGAIDGHNKALEDEEQDYPDLLPGQRFMKERGYQ